jgi:hypothetical protein
LIKPKSELIKRNITEKQQDIYFEQKKLEKLMIIMKMKNQKKANETEKYLKMILIVIISPLYLSDNGAFFTD